MTAFALRCAVSLTLAVLFGSALAQKIPATPVAPPLVTPTPAPSPVPEAPQVAPPSTPPPGLPQPALPNPGAGVRGLWVDAFGPGLKTRAQAMRTVEDAAWMGFNTLFVQTFRRGDCLCLKSGLPAITDRDFEKNFDPLALVTRLAHARGMRVIAWVSVTGMYNAGSPNSNPNSIFRLHGPSSGAQSWLARRPDGSWLEAGRDGWLDVGIPAAAEYVTQGVINLVRNYPVDGIQLDRIRYPDGGNWGYDPKVLARYRTETGKTGVPAADDPDWMEWKRQQVTALVRRIALEVKAVRSNAWITAATITYFQPPRAGDLVSFRRKQTYADVFQDWPTWMYDGLLELNVLMNYKRDPVGDQAYWFDGWNAFARSVSTRADGQQAGVAAGSALYLNDPAVSAAQASRAVGAGLGWVGYAYRTPTQAVYNQTESQARGLETLRGLLRADGAALSAPTTWTDAAPTSRGLIGRITGTPTPGSRLVEALQNGQVVAQCLTDGNGYYGFASLSAGSVEVHVSGQRWVDTIPERGVVRLPDLLVQGTPGTAPKP